MVIETRHDRVHKHNFRVKKVAVTTTPPQNALRTSVDKNTTNNRLRNQTALTFTPKIKITVVVVTVAIIYVTTLLTPHYHVYDVCSNVTVEIRDNSVEETPITKIESSQPKLIFISLLFFLCYLK